MFWRKNADVLIAGAGPVGLFAAVSLARAGIRTQVVDSEWRPGAHSYALALHPSSLRLLESIGVREAVLDSSLRVRHVEFFERGGHVGTAPLQHLNEDFSFVSVMRQEALESILERTLAGYQVRVEWNHELSHFQQGEDGVSILLNRLESDSRGYGVAHTEKVIGRSYQLKVPFLIGADGYRSDVRRMLGASFNKVGPEKWYAVFEFETDFNPGDSVRVVLGEGQNAVMWPLPGGFCRWSFEVEPAGRSRVVRHKDRFFGDPGAGHIPVLEEESLKRMLSERAPWFTGSVGRIAWRAQVPFQRGYADRFGSGRVWLAGDAGHVEAPLGMQSMNIGLTEASELAASLVGVIKEGHSAEALEAYGRRRVSEWRRHLDVEGHVRTAAGAPDWVARHAGAVWESLPVSGRDLTDLAAGLGLRLESREDVAA